MGCLILWFGFVLAQLLASVAMGQIYHVSGKVTGGPKNLSIVLYSYDRSKDCIYMVELCMDRLCKKKVDQVRTKLPNGTVSSKDYYETYEFWIIDMYRVNVLEFRSEGRKIEKRIKVFHSSQCNDKKDCVLNIEWPNSAKEASFGRC
uniref:Secreted protein n=1 Tax=Romanomermis culicivorax TaxID=13658 RepID=A0A915JPC6_ROMCU